MKMYVMWFVISFLIVSVIGEEINDRECITHNFEDDYDTMFNKDSFMCSIIPGTWEVENFNVLGVSRPHEQSTKVKVPTPSTPSCMSTVPFKISTGLLEINVHMDFNDGDGLSVLVFDSEDDSTPLGGGIVRTLQGWNTVPINILVPDVVLAYIVFIGYASENSSLLIDSLRFIPDDLLGSEDEHRSCRIYTECTRYNFEKDFYNLMTNNIPACNPLFTRHTWNLGRYKTTNIEAFHQNSTKFMSNTEGELSCVASFQFEISTGVLDVNVFSDYDGAFLTIQIIDVRDETFIGGGTVQLLNEWQTISFNMNPNDVFQAYVVFIGNTYPGNNLLVDSFRFVPEKVRVCPIYPDDDGSAIEAKTNHIKS